MKASEIYEKVAQEFPGVTTEFNGEALDPYFIVNSAPIKEVCICLRDDPELKFEVLSDLTGLDPLSCSSAWRMRGGKGI